VAHQTGEAKQGQADPSFGSASTRDRIVYELLELRNERGATLPRIGGLPTMVSLGSAWRRANRQGSDDKAAALELLRHSIGDLHPRERDLLLAQFGFTYDQDSRERREAAYLGDVQRHGSPGSMSSFDRWSRRGLEQLAQRMIDRAEADSTPVAPEAEIDPPDDPEDDPLEDPLIPRATVDRYRFREGTVLHDLVSERHVTCRAAGDHVYLTHHTLFSDNSEGVLEIRPIFGCRKVRQFHEDGRLYFLLELTKTLRAGEEYWFSYRVVSHAPAAMASRVQRTLSADEGRWLLDIEFANVVPIDVSRFEGLNHQQAGLRERRRRAVRPHDGSRYIHEVWRGLRKGLTYGVDWEWPRAELTLSE
jgi:hypothetical protein